jgi:hypothetical protein
LKNGFFLSLPGGTNVNSNPDAASDEVEASSESHQATNGLIHLASIPKIDAFGMMFDPFKSTNPNVGKRRETLPLVRRAKEIVIITAHFEGAGDFVKAKLASLDIFRNIEDFYVRFVMTK